MKLCLSALLLIAVPGPLATAQKVLRSTTQHPLQELGSRVLGGHTLVSGFNSDAVHAYRSWDAQPSGSTAVPGAQSIVRGFDGLLYVCAEKVNKVLRLDEDTLALVDEFVRDDPLTPADENGPLNGPTAATFGPDGDLFVASFNSDQILRFDGVTGAYEGIFVAAGLGGLNGPDAGTKFGPDGMLYVPSFFTDSVLRYDDSGVFVDAFVAVFEGGLRQPRDLVFHQGAWYVASSGNGRILKFNAAGTFLRRFANTPTPYSLAFNPHDGHLYVVNLGSNTVSVLDENDGSFLGSLFPAGSGGLDGSVFIFFSLL